MPRAAAWQEMRLIFRSLSLLPGPHHLPGAAERTGPPFLATLAGNPPPAKCLAVVTSCVPFSHRSGASTAPSFFACKASFGACERERPCPRPSRGADFGCLAEAPAPAPPPYRRAQASLLFALLGQIAILVCAEGVEKAPWNGRDRCCRNVTSSGSAAAAGASCGCVVGLAWLQCIQGQT
ncbi:hypothetical protein GQ54DRAFT_60352 [Martensiomyces pterosporus]|nr:hypothetical protein GQ54DRAFT_60352 [Martensiomyces pterosporus]